MAAYRLLNSESFEPGALIAPHQQAIAKRCVGHACVVVSQDTFPISDREGDIFEDYQAW